MIRVLPALALYGLLLVLVAIGILTARQSDEPAPRLGWADGVVEVAPGSLGEPAEVTSMLVMLIVGITCMAGVGMTTMLSAREDLWIAYLTLGMIVVFGFALRVDEFVEFREVAR